MRNTGTAHVLLADRPGRRGRAGAGPTTVDLANYSGTDRRRTSPRCWCRSTCRRSRSSTAGSTRTTYYLNTANAAGAAGHGASAAMAATAPATTGRVHRHRLRPHRLRPGHRLGRRLLRPLAAEDHPVEPSERLANGSPRAPLGSLRRLVSFSPAPLTVIVSGPADIVTARPITREVKGLRLGTEAAYSHRPERVRGIPRLGCSRGRRPI